MRRVGAARPAWGSRGRPLRRAAGRGARALSTAIQGRTAVVTGSTSGIGLGMLEAFAQEGCNVVMNGFGDEQEISSHVARIKDAYGVGAIYNAADMTQPAQVRGMVQGACRAARAALPWVRRGWLCGRAPAADGAAPTQRRSPRSARATFSSTTRGSST